MLSHFLAIAKRVWWRVYDVCVWGEIWKREARKGHTFIRIARQQQKREKRDDDDGSVDDGHSGNSAKYGYVKDR